jgi:hypothetical protein
MAPVMKTEIDKEQTNNNNDQTNWNQLPILGRFLAPGLLKQKYAKNIYKIKKKHIYLGAFST